MGTVLLTAALPGEEGYLAGHVAREEGKYSEAVKGFAAAAQAGGPLAGYANVRGWEAAWLAGDRAADQAAWAWYQSAPDGPEKDLCASRLGVRFAQTGRAKEAAALLLPLVAIDPVPWWMDAVLWEAGDALTRAGGETGVGYTCFQRIVDRPGYAPQRNDAARRLMNSPDAGHRLSAAVALFRAGGFDEVDGIVQGTALGLKDENGGALSLEAFEARVVPEAGLRKANAQNPWFPLLASRVVRTAWKAGDTLGAQGLALWLLEMFPESREAGDSVWFVARALAAKADPGSLTLYDVIAEKAIGYWRNTNAANEVVQYWLMKNDLDKAQAAAESLGARFPESKFRAENYFDLAMRWRAQGEEKKALRNLVFAVNSGPGDFFAHRSLQLLHDALPHAAVQRNNLLADGTASVLQPMPGLMATPPALPAAVSGDPRVQRAQFFGLNGMEEAEWEALEIVRGLKGTKADDGWYLALADAGVGFTAQQWADKVKWDLEGSTRGLARWRLEFPRPYFTIYQAQGKALGVDPYFLLAVSRQESTFRASIKSRSGATGVMQLMPSTAKWMVKTTPGVTMEMATQLSSPSNSIYLGSNYISQMLDKFSGNKLFAAAAYNAGPGNMAKWLKARPNMGPDEFVDMIPFEETAGYVRKVLGNYAAYRSIYPEVSAN